MYFCAMKWSFWLKLLLIVYAVLGIAVYYLQDYFLFHPSPVNAQELAELHQPYQEIDIPYDAASNLHILRVLPDTTAQKKPAGAVLFFPGNRNNGAHYAPAATFFTEKGYEVWIPDYPQFGKSTGPLTEERLYANAKQVYTTARTQFAPDSIIIYGRSLGTGIAAQLAIQTASKAVVLEAPYYSIPSLFSRYLPVYPMSRMIKFNLPVYSYIPEIKAPVIIFHGTDDGTIPYANARKLESLLKAKDQFISIENGTHNNVTNSSLYRTTMNALLSQ